MRSGEAMSGALLSKGRYVCSYGGVERTFVNSRSASPWGIIRHFSPNTTRFMNRRAGFRGNPYAKGVKSKAQVRRRRTLGRELPPQANRSVGLGKPRWGAPEERETGTRWRLDVPRVRLRRPWALLCNAVGVENSVEPRW